MEPEFCHQLLDELSDYLDGAAPAEVCAEIEQHLAGCPDCRAVVDTLRRTIRLYHALPEPAWPEAARERLYKALDLTDLFTPRP